MARPLRIEYPGAVYHVTSRGNGRNRIFRDDQDREIFLSSLEDVVTRYNWLCHAYCLMDNHYHLVVETPDGNLSIGMRQLNGVYTQRYNRRHHKTGHLFGGRFKAILVEKGDYLLELCRYVVLNPVRAKVVEKPELWRWSSYQATVGMRKRPDYLTTEWILGLFGSRAVVARREYRKFVQEGIGQESPWGKVQGQVFLGEEGFVERIKGLFGDRKEVREIPRSQRYVNRPGLDQIFSGQEEKEGRNIGIRSAHLSYGYTLREIADYLGIHYTTVSKVIGGKE
ncbi:MAG: transposase [Syntrophaceae bacterium]|nr:transposase [Syntrophaceae bacterium]